MGSEHLDGVVKNLRALVAAEGTREVPDDELLNRYVQSGDEAAFAALVQRHGGMVLGVCRHRLRRLQDAEDACQAVFLILARKASSIRKRESIAGWLHGVAYRVARDHALRIARREAVAADPAAARKNASDDITLREFQAAIDEEFRQLHDEYRAPLVLCYLEGKTRDEAAKQLGWSLSTFRGRLERARTLLRSRLVKRGLLSSVALFTAFEAGSAAAGTMPVHLMVSTTKAALCFAADPAAAAEIISAPVAALTKGVLQSMFIAKVKVAVAASLALGLTGLGAGAGIYRAVASSPNGQTETVVAAADAAPGQAAPAKAVPAKALPPKAVQPAAAPMAQPGGGVGVAPAIVGAPVIAQPIGRIAYPFNQRGQAGMVQDAAVIVVGKVSKIEEKEQDGNKIAVVKIEESIKGVMGLTSIRVGFSVMQDDPTGPNPVILPGGNGAALPIARPAIARLAPPPLTEGQEGLFFLNKHEKADFYVQANPFQGFVAKNTPNFDAQVKQTKELAKFLETPLEKSLNSDKAEDRLLAAGLLILEYRTRKNFSAPMKEEAIDAEQSKKILKVLAEADFTKVDPRLGMTPMDLFFRLGVTAKDGWQPPRVKVIQPLPPVPAPAPGRGAPGFAPGAPAAPGGVAPGVAPAPAPAPAPAVDPAVPGKVIAPKPPVKAPEKTTGKAEPAGETDKPATAPVANPPVKAVPVPVGAPVQVIGGGAVIARPFNNEAYVESIKAWLKKNQDSYRIKRFVETKPTGK